MYLTAATRTVNESSSPHDSREQIDSLYRRPEITDWSFEDSTVVFTIPKEMALTLKPQVFNLNRFSSEARSKQKSWKATSHYDSYCWANSL